MKVGLLNLPYDENYGGNLQRFALMKTLESMGHDVIHLNLRFKWKLPWYKKPYVYLRRLLIKIFKNHQAIVFYEQYSQKKYLNKCEVTDSFYDEHIKHTAIISNHADFLKYKDYDAYIVGSDQVWRKSIADKYLPKFFLDFLKDINVPKIAFAVSFGTNESELTDEEIVKYGLLYSKFNAVSVREICSVSLLEKYGWTSPRPIHLLDPTFLLSKEEYLDISEEKNVEGQSLAFCYILDINNEKKSIINEICELRNLYPYMVTLGDKVSIPQWLGLFNKAEFVITDSYHGLVFSLIFNKPYKLIRNSFRGNARFDSIFEIFGLTDYEEKPDWGMINSIIENNKKTAIEFLLNLEK